MVLSGQDAHVLVVDFSIMSNKAGAEKPGTGSGLSVSGVASAHQDEFLESELAVSSSPVKLGGRTESKGTGSLQQTVRESASVYDESIYIADFAISLSHILADMKRREIRRTLKSIGGTWGRRAWLEVVGM